ncbi:hypothetical protein MPTK1_6g00980 [Marchantia polymorpha subsp. ruderalis]|uniref:Uncharacterized protein n=2 Tax=Marchantia polymorpha TaxID=3197 RepID=A0AAF6BM87_MARPO|nr:hypothetical protein MARPO_0052s0106 [Marchantia polymorpha]BBN13121.1 hypothetical protein Mp_6g00980 [Marchantia polymorpha subsp. ruderalis]|eukprot:PTQ38327.1 hypothetical protein MARPO_0052s0106 [Marchantia polymorpha]
MRYCRTAILALQASAELERQISMSSSSEIGRSSQLLQTSKSFRYWAEPERGETFKLKVSSGENVEVGVAG